MAISNTNDTIASIATGLTNAGISIIRISGPDAFKIASRIFKKKRGGQLVDFSAENVDSHTVHYGYITEYKTYAHDSAVDKQSVDKSAPDAASVDNRVIDEVMLLILKTPSTYTREDTVEIDCHGGITVTKAVLDNVLKAGARLAEPGEFTKRAFLNGRIDLSEAEAVAGIINAKNTMALKNSIKQLGGAELGKISGLREQIITDTAFIEAALDDPEHIEIDGFAETLSEHVTEELAVLEKMIKSADNGRLINEGINTVIVGKPNAGKSTLLNSMLGEERAIVTEIAGTTRDTLEESVSFGGVSLNIIDTAGIRETADTIEKIGVDRAIAALDTADLVLYVVDITDELTEDDFKIADKIREKKVIVLLNKSDLAEGKSFSGEIPDARGKNSLETLLLEIFGKNAAPNILNISAKQGEGLDELEALIGEMFFAGDVLPNDEIYITSARHKECLIEARTALNSVLESIEAGMSEDFFTIDLMNAYTELGQIIGEDTDEDLVDKIFKDFCMGK